MKTPDELLYTRDHEWVRHEGDTATIGITDFAQSELGDIVYVELPENGAKLEAGKEFGTVESVKAVSEIFAPLSGVVVEANGALNEAPEVVNQDPYGKGWIVKIRLGNPSEIASLMDATAYAALAAKGGGA
jgi:glycine cleavage system H protein